MPRYARGAYLDSERLGGPNGLEPRARSLVRIGKRLGKRADRAVAHEAERDARINRIFDDVDVVLTPATAAPAPRLGQGVHRSGVRSILSSTPWVAYTPPWNLTGQPAMAIPAGSTAPAYQPVCSSSRGPARSRRSSRWQPKWSEWPRSSIGGRKAGPMTALIVALVVIGASLVIAEAHVPSYGLLGLSGIAAFAVAGVLAVGAAGGARCSRSRSWFRPPPSVVG